MKTHNGQKFSTFDQDNDDSYSYACAKICAGAWWYASCQDANLNGRYGSYVYSEGINWYNWKGGNRSMKATRMMMRKKP